VAIVFLLNFLLSIEKRERKRLIGGQASPLFKQLRESHRDLAFAAATHAVEKELAAMVHAAGARAEVGVELLQDFLPALEERRDRRAKIDSGTIVTMRRRPLVAMSFTCSLYGQQCKLTDRTLVASSIQRESGFCDMRRAHHQCKCFLHVHGTNYTPAACRRDW
jgi:hypothetical protein